jgi:ATP-binding protein involved in chromosome partitioning
MHIKKNIKPAKHIIGVASGKGGVGKSTVAANLALAFAKKGYKVGIIDADIYGPSIPFLFNLNDEQPKGIDINGTTKIKPLEKWGVQLISIGFLIDPKQALIWRGPMASNAILQLFNDTHWEQLDYMIVDFPPGTGDIQLTISQQVAMDGALIVTTPQKLAIEDVRKAATMFSNEKINVPVLGIIENMSYFTPPELPDKKYYIFGKGGGELLADELNLEILCHLPILEDYSVSGDITAMEPGMDKENINKEFTALTNQLIKKLGSILNND